MGGSGFLSLFCLICCVVLAVSQKPEQIHLSHTGDNEITVAWVTPNETAQSVVLYGLTSGGPYNHVAKGSYYTFLNTGWPIRTEIIHVVKINGLLPKTRYYYICGSPESKKTLSDQYSFEVLPVAGDHSKPLTFAVFGDFGVENARSLPGLLNDTAAGMYDMILHVGDIAYNMQDDNGRVGDAFFNMIQPIAANVPYHVCVGNHEQDLWDTFHAYKERFAMPQVDSYENMYYSVDVGPIHFISFSTEHYFSLEDPFVGLQYDWFVQDLIKANQNRKKVPWIIMYGHRPLYCSDVTRKREVVVDNVSAPDPPPTQDCSYEAEQLRDGFDWFGYRIYGIEKLLYKYGVDLYLCGHEHSYERLFPVYNSTVMNGSVAAPYYNPKATVHIITGSAGCKEGLERFGPHGMGPWSAFRSSTYGYARMTVYNGTHLHWEQVLDSTGKVIDQFWLINEHHGSFAA